MITDYFLSYSGCFLVKKRAWSHFNGSESKSKLDYTGVTFPAVSNMQKVYPTISQSNNESLFKS